LYPISQGGAVYLIAPSKSVYFALCKPVALSCIDFYDTRVLLFL